MCKESNPVPGIYSMANIHKPPPRFLPNDWLLNILMATHFKVRPVEKSCLASSDLLLEREFVCGSGHVSSNAQSEMVATEGQTWTWALGGSIKPLTQLSPVKRSGWWKAVIFRWWLVGKPWWVSHLCYDFILPLNIVTAVGCCRGQGRGQFLLTNHTSRINSIESARNTWQRQSLL